MMLADIFIKRWKVARETINNFRLRKLGQYSADGENDRTNRSTKQTVMRICHRWMQEKTTDQLRRSLPPCGTTAYDDSGAKAHEGQGLLCSSQYTSELGAEVREQVSQSGGQYEVRPPVLKFPIKLGTHFRSTANRMKWYWARTRDKASHGPIPIPLGYRGQELIHETKALEAQIEKCEAKSDDCSIGLNCSNAIRGLLTTNVVVLNHDQVTRKTLELAPLPPNFHTTPTGEHLSHDRFKVHRPPTR
ncbi:hypothetical protein TNCV_4347091 [Trichonephila clavipes]|nr:hypothetical protein TNCV_4347091 [Trichonephila clavipes]